MMTCVNVAEFELISELEKYHCMIETRHLEDAAIFKFIFCTIFI